MNTYFLVKQTLGKKACLGIQNLLLRAQNINFLLEELNFFQLQQSLEFRVILYFLLCTFSGYSDENKSQSLCPCAAHHLMGKLILGWQN